MAKILIESQYLPCIAFYTLALEHHIYIEKWENYQKGSFRNRTTLLSSQGPLSLSIPLVSGKNSQTLIQQVGIDHSSGWQQNHIRAIKACYGKSPYFEYYFSDLQDIITSKLATLLELNSKILNLTLKWLDLDSVNFTTAYDPNPPEGFLDYRNKIGPKSKHQSFINDHFQFPPYDQVFLDEIPFVPNLSILDLIFCKGPEARLYLKKILK